MRSPYRDPVSPACERTSASANADVAWPLAIFWVLCVARVIAGAIRHETFGVDGSLAFVTMVLVPIVLLRLRRR
jgi:hypothetical protein